MGANEKIDFAKYNFERVKKGGVLVGGVCLRCHEFRENTAEDRLEGHFNICYPDDSAGIDADDPKTPTSTGRKKRNADDSVDLGNNNTPTVAGPSKKNKRIKGLFGNRSCLSPKSSESIMRFGDLCNETEAKQIKTSLLRAILTTNSSFDFINHPSFKDFLGVIRPAFGRDHFKNGDDLLLQVPDKYNKMLARSKINIGDNCVIKLTFHQSEEKSECVVVAGNNFFIKVLDCPDEIITLDVIECAVSYNSKLF